MTELYNIGDMIEVAWEYSNPRGLFKPTRTIRMILLDPIYEKESRYPLLDPHLRRQDAMDIKSWRVKVIYDTHPSDPKTSLPYNNTYQVKWLDSIERQNKLKIISRYNNESISCEDKQNEI